MVIYATHPTCAIVGYAEISRVIESTPAAIWEIFGNVEVSAQNPISGTI